MVSKESSFENSQELVENKHLIRVNRRTILHAIGAASIIGGFAGAGSAAPAAPCGQQLNGTLSENDPITTDDMNLSPFLYGNPYDEYQLAIPESGVLVEITMVDTTTPTVPYDHDLQLVMISPDGRFYGEGLISAANTRLYFRSYGGTHTILATTNGEVPFDYQISTSVGELCYVPSDSDAPTTNQSPTASFNYDPSNPEVGKEIMFNASGSSDNDGEIVSYAWDFGDGTTASGQVTSHTYTIEGDYDVTLTVTDDDDAAATETQTVSVVIFADPVVVDGEEYLPQDLDGDGRYEDIDGDGTVVNGKETSALAKIIEAHGEGSLALTDAQIDALDFNGDGQLTGADNGAYNRNR